MNLLDYLEQAEKNLMIMSRTANQVLDLSTSVRKKDRIQDGLTAEDAAIIAQINFRSAISCAYENRKMNITGIIDLDYFIKKLSQIVNQGILKSDYIYRVDDSEKYPYTLVCDLPTSCWLFYSKMFRELETLQEPIRLAALAEWHIDIRDHFFADGCGKTARVVSAWVLMRAELPLPDLSPHGTMANDLAKKTYYAYTPNYRRNDNIDQDNLDFEKFHDYYTKLFRRP